MELQELTGDIKVLYVTATSFPAGILEAFKKLEDRLPNKTGRTLFGISAPENGTIIYKAAASILPGDEGKNYDLDTFTILKGNYLTETIPDFMKNTPAIGATFQKLLKDERLDTNFPCVEWYNGDDVKCMVRLNK